jgi:hypothetical protein
LEPTEIYNRNKRNLAIFAGLLALVMVGEIKDIGESQISLFPFKFATAQNIPHVLFAVAAYCFYEFLFAWGRQSDDIRKSIRTDFFITATLAGFSLVAYAFLYWIVDILKTTPEIIVISVTVSIVAFGGAVASYLFTELRKWRGATFAIRRDTIRERLLERGWVLNFNPTRLLASKAIEFDTDGTIGEGSNSNEFRWELNGRDLRIWRANGELQNEFRYDESTDRFVSTDSASAKGIKGQIIHRDRP